MALKNFGFSAVVVVTLALGIGANVGLFSVVNGVLLNPLPFPRPEQLVTLDQSKPNFDTGAMPYPNFRDLRKENRTFSAMTISRGFAYTLIGTGEAERVSARLVSADFFSVFDVKPALGRAFTPGEDEPGAVPVAMISSELWQRKFGAAADVISKSLTLDDKTYAIIGVVPADVSLFRATDVYVPIGQWNNPALKNRGAALGLHGFGRMKPGVTLEQAQSDLSRVMANLAATYPDTNKNNGAKIFSLKERVVGGIGSTLWLLFGAVGFVLLIACLNISNLLLARSTGRNREFAIRVALGASRWRLLRQSLTESLLLALVGGNLGLLMAIWGTSAAIALLPTTLPRSAEIKLDMRVLIFTVGLSVLTGILAGLTPALRMSRRRLSGTLKEGGRGVNTAGSRAQGAFVAVEVALALVLLVGAGLMIRSLSALWKVDPGFRSDNVLSFSLSLSPSMRSIDPQATRAALRSLSDQIASSPGVRAVSFSAGSIPLVGEDDLFFWVEGEPKPVTQSEMSMALVYRVEPGYLTAMDIPLKQGRFFEGQDNEKSPRVAVIDEVFARKYFGTADPIGKRILQDDGDPLQIIGVVGHVRQWSIDADEERTLQAQLYEPFRQFSDNSMNGLAAGLGVVARYEGGSPPFDLIRRVVQSQNKENVISRPQTMNEVIAASLAQQRFLMILLESFAVTALLLASLGLYGVISYVVGQRTQEIGIRLALGAQRKDVLRLILGQGMTIAIAGVALGLVAAVGLTRLMSNMIYGVSTSDPATFAIITLLLTMVALLACFVPARRATRINPLVALRHE
jgi:predicted permease